MKSFGLFFVICLVLLDLFGHCGVEAALNRNGNGVLYCKWSTRKTCSKTSTYCVRLSVTANMVTTVTCKLYQNECKYRMDKCLQQTGKYLPYTCMCMMILNYIMSIPLQIMESVALQLWRRIVRAFLLARLQLALKFYL